MSDRRLRPEWTLSLYGDFKLVSPEGDEVHLSNRKVEALLAVLAAHRKFGIDRQALAEILWPQKDGSANLRQALSLLKKALPGGTIESSRSHCRISSEFTLASDLEEEHSKSGEAFMPGHDGEWFQAMRAQTVNEIEDRTCEFPTSDFARTLEWLAENAPSSMYGVMREARNFTLGLPSADALRLLGIAGEDAKSVLWRAYWISYFGKSALDDYNKCSWQLLSAANAAADHPLSVEVSYQLGASLLVQGKLKTAAKAIEACQTHATRSREQGLRAKAASIYGVSLIHSGNITDGLPKMERSEVQLGDGFAAAHAQALRAFLETSNGLHKRALITLATPEHLGKSSGHRRLMLMCSVSRANALISTGEVDEALKVIRPATEARDAAGGSFFIIYALETAAKAHLLKGDETLAAQYFLSARKARASRGMPYTFMDKIRIGENFASSRLDFANANISRMDNM